MEETHGRPLLEDGRDPSVPNSDYYTDLVREFSRTIVVRREGIVEVDLRLRPYSNDGPLVVIVDGSNAYYSEEGDVRQFKRLALVNLRPVAVDPELGPVLSSAGTVASTPEPGWTSRISST